MRGTRAAKRSRALIAAAVGVCAIGASAQQFQLKSLIVDTATGTGSNAVFQQGDLKRFYEAEKLLVYQILAQLNISRDSLPDAVRRAIDKPQTTSVGAFEAFARGIDLADQGRFADARAAFTEATRLDPGFALAKTLGQTMPAVNLPTPAAVTGALENQNARASQTGSQIAQSVTTGASVPVPTATGTTTGTSSSASSSQSSGSATSSSTSSGTTTSTTTTPSSSSAAAGLSPCQLAAIYCYLSSNGSSSTTTPTDKTAQQTQTDVASGTQINASLPSPPPSVATPAPTPLPVAGPPRTFMTLALALSPTSPTPPPSPALLNPYISTNGIPDLTAGYALDQQLPPGITPNPAPTLTFSSGSPTQSIQSLNDATPEVQSFYGFNPNPTGPIAKALQQGTHTILTDPVMGSGTPAYLGEWFPLTLSAPTVTVPTVLGPVTLDIAGGTAFAVLASATPASVLAGLQSAAAQATYTYNVPLLLQGTIALDPGGIGSGVRVYTQPITAGTVNATLLYGAGSLVMQSFSISGTGATPARAANGPQSAFAFTLDVPSPGAAVSANGSFSLSGSGTLQGDTIEPSTSGVTTISVTGAQAKVAGQISGLRAGGVLGSFAVSGGTITATPSGNGFPSMSAQGVFGVRRP